MDHRVMQGVQMDQAKYWVGFQRVPFIGPVRIRRLIDHFGDLEQAWTAQPVDLQGVLDERAIQSLEKVKRELALDREMEKIERLGITVLTIQDDAYPRLLREIPAPPPVLYLKGEFTDADKIAIAIVGTRRATSYGREMARRIASELAAAGVTVVSGLARGIDAIAHQSALEAGGRTIAVLGSGVNVIYPSEHRQLAERIVEQGALVADYPPDTKPDAVNFPARNRIISGMSLGTLVVEAPTRSGALITCDFAADQGREVFVVPGSALSAASEGTNRLLRDGARAVTCAADLLDDLDLGRRREQVAVQQAFPMSEAERRILSLLTAEPQHIDELITAANLSISEGAALLTQMELQGFVRNLGAQHYARV
jgi:DNA processing protein